MGRGGYCRKVSTSSAILVAESPMRSNSGDDMVHCHELAQIPGHRLKQGDEPDAFPVDALFQVIDGRIPGDHLTGQVPIGCHHCLNALFHRSGGQVRQFREFIQQDRLFLGKFGLAPEPLFRCRCHPHPSFNSQKVATLWAIII